MGCGGWTGRGDGRDGRFEVEAGPVMRSSATPIFLPGSSNACGRQRRRGASTQGSFLLAAAVLRVSREKLGPNGRGTVAARPQPFWRRSHIGVLDWGALVPNVERCSSLCTRITPKRCITAAAGFHDKHPALGGFSSVYLSSTRLESPSHTFIMSEERSKISLRSGKRKAKPTISAPRQISNPILQDGSATAAAVAVPGATSEPPPRPRLRPPPMAGGKVIQKQSLLGVVAVMD